MAIDVAWYDKTETVLCITFEFEWSWEEYTAAMMRARDLINAKHTISLFFDFTRTNYTTSGLSFEFLRQTADLIPENVAFIAFIGTDSLSMRVISTYFLVWLPTREKTFTFYNSAAALHALTLFQQAHPLSFLF